MSLVSNVHVFLSLFVLIIVVEDSVGIVFATGFRSKPRRKATMCRFDNRNYTIGQSWHPYLEPNGINFCITCKCQKNGYTHCARKQCPPISCPGRKAPRGKCCPVCPVAVKPTVALKQCYHEGNPYISGQVWETSIKGQDGRKSNCADCVCNNGVVSCTIRICPSLKCPEIFQRKETNTCCKRCGGLPLQAEGETKNKEYTKELEGSCTSNGIYYKNRDLWNPITLPSEIKAFQYPNCRICTCQNTNVTCNIVQCPSLSCKNPKKKHPKDCCKTCKNTAKSASPVIYKYTPKTKKIKGNIFPHCNFTKKIYKHNTSWNPVIPGLDIKLCARCTCKFSRVSCERIVCKNGGNCANSCSIPSKKRKLPKAKVTRHRDCSGERVQVYLLMNGGQRKTKTKRAKQNNYMVKIVLIYTKDANSVRIRHWNVAENNVYLRTSKLSQARFEKRKTNYVKLGVTKSARINRFLNKEKVLSRCYRSCKNKAKDFINVLRNRVRYFKKDCKPVDSFRSLVPSPF